MKIMKVFIIITVLVLVFGVGFLIFSINARLQGTEYQFQVDAVLTAASIANEEDPLTVDPALSVTAEYEGRKVVVVPGNYTALSSYLRKDAASMLFSALDRRRLRRTGHEGPDLPDPHGRRKPVAGHPEMLYDGHLSRR